MALTQQIAGHQRAGKGARITVGGAALNYGEFNCEDKADDLDETNFESGGIEQGTIGIEWVEYDASGYYDASNNPYDTPALFPRDNLANMRFYINSAESAQWIFTLARVLSAKNGAPVRQLITFAWSGKSQGPFSRPTGSF